MEVQNETQVEETTVQDEVQDENMYVGSKELNPDQHPFTPEFEHEVEKHKYSNEKIDEFITVDPSIIMTNEQIEELDKKSEEMEISENTDDEQNQDDKEVKDKKEDEQSNKDNDQDIENFYKETKITKEEFNNLNEDAQKYIVEKFEKQDSGNEQLNSLKTEYDEYKNNINTILEDPYIKTRIQEKQDNRDYLPKQINTLTENEYEQIQNAESVEDCNKIIDKIVNDRVEPHVKNTWVKIENENHLKQEKTNCEKLLLSIGELDKEFKIDVKSFGEIPNNPKVMEKYNNGLGKIVQYLQDKGENWSSINRKSAKEILAMYNIFTGRDQKILKEVEENTKKSLLKRLQNPTIAKDAQSRKAKTMKNGAGSKGYSGNGGRGLSGNLDRDTLVQQVAKGDVAEYNRLGDYAAATANQEQIDFLNGVYSDAMVYRKQNNERN